MASNGVMESGLPLRLQFLLYYGGVVFMFVMAALLLPLLRHVPRLPAVFLANLLWRFAFRSPAVGAAITLSMCLTLLPCWPLRFRPWRTASRSWPAAPTSCSRASIWTGLALLFWRHHHRVLDPVRHPPSPRSNTNTGLVTAIAFESLVKLTALFVLLLAAAVTASSTVPGHGHPGWGRTRGTRQPGPCHARWQRRAPCC